MQPLHGDGGMLGLWKASSWGRPGPDLLSVLLLTLAVVAHAAAPGSPFKTVDYNRDIQPILSENCYACHGPDHEKRKAGLRLDVRDGAFKPLKSGGFAIVPGEPAKSELVRRITTPDDDDRMPPVKSGKSLSTAQIETLQHWVAEGAKWSQHWAYIKPERPPLPRVKNQSWPRNEIDHFILARLEKEGLKPSPESDRNRLIRRTSLDLRGLPPTVSEVEDFLYDNSPGAYDKLVDRFLNSPHYGERMAQEWLDLARFADSQGYHHDSHRDLWPWRDWVIKAFNTNMPFDEFTTEQLAGDLLPNPTREQRIATGFHRNEMTTSEGGAMPEEYAVKYVVGRVDTTARVWLGTSLACAECHDHKYDPITQKDYYRFFAYFNTIAENGLDQDINPVPRLTLDTPQQRARVEQFTKQVGTLESAVKVLLEAPNADQDAAQAKWEGRFRQDVVSKWTVLEAVNLSSSNGVTLSKLPDDSILASGPNPDRDAFEITLHTRARYLTGLRLETWPDPSLPVGAKAGRSVTGDFILTHFEAVTRSLHPEQARPLPTPDLGLWFVLGPFKAGFAPEAFEKAFGPEGEMDLSKTFADGSLKWSERTDWKDGEPHVLTGANSANYVYRVIQVKEPGLARLAFGSQDGLQVWWNGRKVLSKEGSRPLVPGQDKIVVWLGRGENKLLLKTSSGESGSAFHFELLTEPVVEQALALSAAADFNQPGYSVTSALDPGSDSGWGVGGDSPEAAGAHQAFFRAQDPFGFKEGTEIKVRLQFESAKPHHTLGRFRLAITDSGGLTEFMGLPDAIRADLIRPGAELSPARRGELQAYYRQKFVPEVQEMNQLLERERKSKQDFVNSIPVTMVMQEMERPRETFVLVRGNFQQRGEKVTPGVPEALFPMPAGYASNRLGLAQWLMNPDNPLVSRVTVNHFWQHYFGTGLVKTAEDFGAQGDWPSHPELLDWLATEFVRTKWDVKAMQRLIVTSATYRQSPVVTAELLQRDPDDRLLARFPRLRLDAEAIRDNALAVSGLLNAKVGGPSVYPYQPPGLWEAVAFEGTRKWEQSPGPDSYRRGLYTYWRRSLPYPSLITFDAPARETCTVRRPRTNTPLQALTLMNDPVYVEAARAFGQRIMREGGPSVEARLTFAFRVCLGRLPTKPERELLEAAYRKHLDTFTQDRVSAVKLIHVGTSPAPLDLDICELAAWTLISSTLLNLDETITKG